MSGEIIQDSIRQKYGAAANQALAGERARCGGDAGGCCSDPVSEHLYDTTETEGLPQGAVLASLGCGNPTALADLRPGETVLDLGSGGGIDVLLSAKRVGPTGKVYGLDLTDPMLALARENQRQAGVTNVEFLRGEMEAIPLPDASVDVVISNCVINLSTDKPRALAEAFRVLRPGGRFAVSDVVVRRAIPAAVRQSLELWVGCVAGALDQVEYRRILAEVGFEGIDLEPTRIYHFEDARAVLTGSGLDSEVLAREVAGCIMGAFVRATKPLTSEETTPMSSGECCSAECCA